MLLKFNNNLFYFFDHSFQNLQMIFELAVTQFCNWISGICFSADKPFMHFDKAILFKWNQVSGQIAIGYFQHGFQVIETDLFIHYEHTHYAQPYAAVKYFI